MKAVTGDVASAIDSGWGARGRGNRTAWECIRVTMCGDSMGTAVPSCSDGLTSVSDAHWDRLLGIHNRSDSVTQESGRRIKLAMTNEKYNTLLRS